MATAKLRHVLAFPLLVGLKCDVSWLQKGKPIGVCLPTEGGITGPHFRCSWADLGRLWSQQEVKSRSMGPGSLILCWISPNLSIPSIYLYMQRTLAQLNIFKQLLINFLHMDVADGESFIFILSCQSHDSKGNPPLSSTLCLNYLLG